MSHRDTLRPGGGVLSNAETAANHGATRSPAYPTATATATDTDTPTPPGGDGDSNT